MVRRLDRWWITRRNSPSPKSTASLPTRSRSSRTQQLGVPEILEPQDPPIALAIAPSIRILVPTIPASQRNEGLVERSETRMVEERDRGRKLEGRKGRRRKRNGWKRWVGRMREKRGLPGLRGWLPIPFLFLPFARTLCDCTTIGTYSI